MRSRAAPFRPVLPAVEKGVRQVLGAGALAGYPMQDVRVTVYDGKHHPVDSKEVAFIAAGKRAFLDAISHAHPQVLEPIVDLEVSAPSSIWVMSVADYRPSVHASVAPMPCAVARL